MPPTGLVGSAIARFVEGISLGKWLRGRDLNPRPLGYEPAANLKALLVYRHFARIVSCLANAPTLLYHSLIARTSRRFRRDSGERSEKRIGVGFGRPRRLADTGSSGGPGDWLRRIVSRTRALSARSLAAWNSIISAAGERAFAQTTYNPCRTTSTFFGGRISPQTTHGKHVVRMGTPTTSPTGARKAESIGGAPAATQPGLSSDTTTTKGNPQFSPARPDAARLPTWVRVAEIPFALAVALIALPLVYAVRAVRRLWRAMR